MARKKIEELQEKVNDLSSQNITMEEERQELNVVLEQLSQNVDTLQMNIRRLNRENEALNEKVRLATVFIASEIKIRSYRSKRY